MDMQERINTYWSKRADEFSDARYTDMQGVKRKLWSDLIRAHLPEKEHLKVLDLGTGAGFFAFLLHDLGAQVTAIDYSEDMLANARKNAEKPGIRISPSCRWMRRTSVLKMRALILSSPAMSPGPCRIRQRPIRNWHG